LLYSSFSWVYNSADTYHGGISINALEPEDGFVSAAYVNSVYTRSSGVISGYKRLNVGDTIEFAVKNVKDTSNIYPNIIQLFIKRVGF
jgi:hypothetical protein